MTFSEFIEQAEAVGEAQPNCYSVVGLEVIGVRVGFHRQEPTIMLVYTEDKRALGLDIDMAKGLIEALTDAVAEAENEREETFGN